MNSSLPPLAERLRPSNIREFIGQEHLTGENGILRRILDSGSIPSMIFWGPPGTGKTTLANIIANQANAQFFKLNAINAGVKDIREVIQKAKGLQRCVLFIDEIHRFNKSQQDALLGAVEKGLIRLIGATTENPSFELNNALLSRCQVYTLNPFGEEELLELLDKALTKDAELSKKDIVLKEYNALLSISSGDGRKLLNLLELVVDASPSQTIELTDDYVRGIATKQTLNFDRAGDIHYEIASAFIKSIRGGDPDAALYYMARMIEGGEDPKFIARRIIISASEDIGNANPTALVIANECFRAIEVVGWPEGRIILAQAVTYLACSPKSNAAYKAINQAQKVVRETGNLPIPLHLRGAYTKLDRELGHGAGYLYPHDYQGNFVKQDYLPESLKGTKFYYPEGNAREEEFRKRLWEWWGQ